ncbi:MAG: regulatory iron-sulfur-containing complex subunit RicT, partial [Gemmatimonadota bacterium]
MPQTVEVRFKGTRRDFFLWPDDQEPLHLREAVVVDAERGTDLGRVHSAGAAAEKKCGGACTSCAVGEGIQEGRTGGAIVGDSAQPIDAAPKGDALAEAETPPQAQEQEQAPAPPTAQPPSRPFVLRRASQEDIRLANELRVSEEDCRRQIIEKVRQHKLEMKVSDTEWQWDKSKLTVFFTAEKRVDFRALVRDLATIFRTRIELRQIGVRDEAARLKGVGRCGREYCCSTWLTELSPVSLSLAKDQHLSLNPSQISGGCGRLLCCLKYEH